MTKEREQEEQERLVLEEAEKEAENIRYVLRNAHQ